MNRPAPRVSCSTIDDRARGMTCGNIAVFRRAPCRPARALRRASVGGGATSSHTGIPMSRSGESVRQSTTGDDVTGAGATRVLDLAARHPLLRDIGRGDLTDLLAQCTASDPAAGTCVLSAGQINDTLFVVLAGELFAILDPLQPASRVTIAAGECFGEMSLLEDKPVSADVVAGDGACVLALPAAVFWSAIARTEGVARSLLRVMSERMRQRSELVVKGARERFELEAVQRELQVAQEVQMSMLPDGDDLLKDHPQVEAAAYMVPAKVVGGDFFDAFGVDEDCVFVAIGDVAGKGMPAALFMARSLATLRLEVVSGRDEDGLLARFNDAMCEHNVHSTFVTVFAGFLDTRDGQLRYFNAGHHDSLVISPDGRVTPLPRPEGMVAGFMPGCPYELARYPLSPGDIVVAFTDGVTEAQNDAREFFGEARLREVLQVVRPRRAEDVLAAIRAALRGFTRDAPQFDDITVLALRYLGNA